MHKQRGPWLGDNFLVEDKNKRIDTNRLAKKELCVGPAESRHLRAHNVSERASSCSAHAQLGVRCSEGMYTPPPSSSRGGIQRHGQFHHAATASSWDSDNVFYVGMDYPNMAGACSQKPTASIHPGNYAGGCSQNKTAVPVDMASAGSAVGELASRYLSLRNQCLPVPRIS